MHSIPDSMHATKVFLFIAVIFLSSYSCASNSTPAGARILCMFGFSTKSHSHVFSALTTTLARRGHQVTVVTSFPLENPPVENYRQIDVPAIRQVLVNFDAMFLDPPPLLTRVQNGWTYTGRMCPLVLQIPEVKELLRERFDLVVVSTTNNECCIPFAHHNNAPLVMISASGSGIWTTEVMGNTEPASYVPTRFLPYGDNMSFVQRFVNTCMKLLVYGLRTWVYMPRMDVEAMEFFGDDIPAIGQLERNATLALLNTHTSLNSPRPLLQNIIEVGGMHVTEKSNALPEDIQKFLDEAPEGAIYFSLGATLHSSHLPQSKTRVFMDAFAELPQLVLWKWETEEMEGQPINVKLGKWLPQQDILAHPHIRLFITHGGLLSLQEAVAHGVPMLGIPVFSDQGMNMHRAQTLGLGLALDMDSMTKDSLLAAIRTILNNTSYSNAARSAMKMFRDQPQPPLDRAVFWLEHVLRHHGTPHLRTPATQLSWYQLHLLDVVAAILVLFVITVSILLASSVIILHTLRYY